MRVLGAACKAHQLQLQLIMLRMACSSAMIVSLGRLLCTECEASCKPAAGRAQLLVMLVSLLHLYAG